ncbi:MAG: tetratricopeptide repeat protein, partial [Chitinophagales bacterium]
MIKIINTVKRIIIFFRLFCFFHIVYAQNYNVDSLKKVLNTNIADSTRIEILSQIGLLYLNTNLDSSMMYISQFNQVPSRSKKMEARGLNLMGDIYLRTGNASKALELLLKSLKIEETLQDPFGISMLYWNLGKVYQSQNDNAKAIEYFLKVLKMSPIDQLGEPRCFAMGRLGLLYMEINHLDTALYYTQSSYQ